MTPDQMAAASWSGPTENLAGWVKVTPREARMALIKRFTQARMDRNSVHQPVDCTYTVFADDRGTRYLQLDTYGSKERKLTGKKSQSIQLGPEALAQLRTILESV